MGIPKNLWEIQKKDTPVQDKETIEALKERLNDKIMKDPKLAKKAALIIELWLKDEGQKKKPKP
jgi:hypothetical protein